MSKLVRTATYPVLSEGPNPGEIVLVEEKEMPTQYGDSKLRDALNFKVKVKDIDGVTGYLYFAPTITWSPKGKLMQTLQDLNAVPGIGEELNLGQFIGMAVTVMIENTEKNDVTYSNIVKMKKRVGATTRSIKRPNKSQYTTEEIEEIFDEANLD